MKLIVGLGNPGRKYEQTRHNVGFVVLAKIAALTSAEPSKVKFQAECAETRVSGEKVVLLWPQTFMNASGQSVRKAVDFYKTSVEEILVVCDDLNLDVGRLRFKRSGSAGGQNGMKDIIRHLSSQDFPRLRIGIGRPGPEWSVSDYVLGKFGKTDTEAIESATTTAAKGAIDWIQHDIGYVMNQYNADPKAAKQKQKHKADRSANGGEQAGVNNETDIQ